MYVTATLMDSLWIYDLRSNEARAIPLSFAGYVVPKITEADQRDPELIMNWSKRYHTAVFPLVTRDLIVVPFVKGVLNYGDPLTLVVIDRATGRRYAVEGAPPVSAVRGDELVTIANPLQDPLRLSVFRFRGR